MMKGKGGVEILNWAIVVDDLMSMINEFGVLFDFALKEGQKVRIDFTEMKFVVRPE